MWYSSARSSVGVSPGASVVVVGVVVVELVLDVVVVVLVVVVTSEVVVLVEVESGVGSVVDVDVLWEVVEEPAPSVVVTVGSETAGSTSSPSVAPGSLSAEPVSVLGD